MEVVIIMMMLISSTVDDDETSRKARQLMNIVPIEMIIGVEEGE